MQRPLNLKLDDSFISSFPPEMGPSVPRSVWGAITSKVKPEFFIKAYPILYSQSLLSQFELSKSEVFDLMRGAASLSKQGAWATRYGGHQFGYWAGQLGDGRAISLGCPLDHQGQAWEWQLKGSGPTPYSRSGDGYAVMRSSYREFVASEALHALRVPTTRALGLMSTGEWVTRDVFYDGHPKNEVGAVCLRLAPSFLRFGHFQILHATREKGLLKKLFDFVLIKHFNLDAHNQSNPLSDSDRVLKLFETISQRTIEMIIHWWRVGFIHGVMNTDNMSIHGLTMDYGPFGWLSDLDPHFTPNTTDFREHRYAFGNQPAIAIWNLAQLASSFAVLHPREKEFEQILQSLEPFFEGKFIIMMNSKMGLPPQAKSKGLIHKLLSFLQRSKLDYTLFWRAWSHWIWEWVLFEGLLPAEGVNFISQQVQQTQKGRKAGLLPFSSSKTLLQNWFESLQRFRYGPPVSVVEFTNQLEDFSELIIEWGEIFKTTAAECSNNQMAESLGETFKQNPIFIPRNHLLFQGANELEEVGALWIKEQRSQESPMAKKIFELSLEPYSVRPWENDFFIRRVEIPDDAEFYSRVPDWGLKTPGCSQLSCSS